MHVPVPADIDAEALAELIADAYAVPTMPRLRPGAARVVAAALPRPRSPIVISDGAMSLVEGYADYGS